jgi:hypothetical protein
MTERLFRLSFMAIPVLWLSACASTPQVDPAVAAALSSRGVDQGTYAKVTQGSVLDYNDILNLLVKKVPQILSSATFRAHEGLQFQLWPIGEPKGRWRNAAIA